MKTYYNEIEPFCLEWLQNLMDAGHISQGFIDDRSIEDVSPTDLVKYHRSHFFAGVAGWELALQLAGWTGPAWTGSCPCQPFSAAGQRKGFTDERHLWPSWLWLIKQCHPSVIFGEQVASKDGLRWLDVVFDDLEAEGYSCGAAVLPSAYFAPHIRQRIWFLGYSGAKGLSQQQCQRGTSSKKMERKSGETSRRNGSPTNPWASLVWLPCRDGKWRPTGIVANTGNDGWNQGRSRTELRTLAKVGGSPQEEGSEQTSALKCGGRQLGKQGASQSIIQPLADGLSDELGLVRAEGQIYISPLIQKTFGRIGRLKAYGNAINPWIAKIFIEAVMEILNEEEL